MSGAAATTPYSRDIETDAHLSCHKDGVTALSWRQGRYVCCTLTVEKPCSILPTDAKSAPV